jgi:hypothetical protein
MSKARDLSVGDVFRLHVYGEVLSVESTDGKRIRVRIALEDQNGGLEFTDAGRELEFTCKPGRVFHLDYQPQPDENNSTSVESSPSADEKGSTMK